MKARSALLAAMVFAGVATTSFAQGRGGPPPRRDEIMSQDQRDQIRTLRERQRRELQDLRPRHREQFERALPPAARERLAQRERQLMREGRAFERQRLLRRDGARGSAAGPGRQGVGPQRGGMGPQRGGVGPQRGEMGPQRGGVGPQGGGMGPQRGGMGMRGRGGMRPPINRDTLGGRMRDGR